MEGRRSSALVPIETGKAVAFAIFNLQARGGVVTHNDPVYRDDCWYPSKSGDLEINVFKEKN